MRQHIKKFVQLCAKNIKLLNPVYEFGSYIVPGQEELANLRPLFPKHKFVGCDLRQGNGVDAIYDIMDINIEDSTIGAVLCLDTYEHVLDPIKATREIYRILKPNGIFILSSVMNYHIHNHPSDYWRFTPSCFEALLKPFTYSFVDYGGKKAFPHTVIGIGCKGKLEIGGCIKNYLNTLKTD